MVKRIAQFFPFILAIVIVLAWPTAQASPLEVRGNTFDFGHVPFGATVKHRVTLLNRGTALIKITRVNPGCGCTQIPLPKREIPAGDSVTLELILETAKIKTGLFHKSPMIFTDNLEAARITVTLTGYNLGPEERGPKIKVDPLSLKWESANGDKPLVLQVTNGSREELRTRIISAPDPSVAEPQFPRKLIKAGGVDSILVRIPHHAGQPALIQESLTFSFTDTKQTRFTIPITIVR